MRLVTPFYLILLCLLISMASMQSVLSQSKVCDSSGLQVGLQVGVPYWNSDVAATPRLGGLGLHVTKPLSARFALRYQVWATDSRGQDWLPSQDVSMTPFRNYRNLMFDQQVQGLFTLTSPQKRVSLFAFGGVGMAVSHAETDLLDNSGMLYSYESFASPESYADRRAVLDALSTQQDGHYETALKGDPFSSQYGKTAKWVPSVSTGLGISWALGNRLALEASYRLTWQGRDDLEGYTQNRLGNASGQNDVLHLASIGVSLCVGRCQSKVVEPEIILPSAPIESEMPNTSPNSAEGAEVKSEIQNLVQAQKQMEDTYQALRTDVDSLASIVQEVQAWNPQLETLWQSWEDQASKAQSSTTTKSFQVFFASGKSEITPGYYSVLAQISTHMQAYPNAVVYIKGFADERGAVDANQKLATARAESTQAFLIRAFDVDPTRITVQGIGEIQTTNPDQEAVSRRVDVSIQ